MSGAKSATSNWRAANYEHARLQIHKSATLTAILLTRLRSGLDKFARGYPENAHVWSLDSLVNYLLGCARERLRTLKQLIEIRAGGEQDTIH